MCVYQERGVVLRRWYDLMVSHSDALAAIITAESGKPLAEAAGEISYSAAFIDWFAGTAAAAVHVCWLPLLYLTLVHGRVCHRRGGQAGIWYDHPNHSTSQALHHAEAAHWSCSPRHSLELPNCNDCPQGTVATSSTAPSPAVRLTCMLCGVQAAPALAAGCPIVIKPGEDTPLSALAAAELAHEAGVPPGIINVVTASRGNTRM